MPSGEVSGRVTSQGEPQRKECPGRGLVSTGASMEMERRCVVRALLVTSLCLLGVTVALVAWRFGRTTVSGQSGHPEREPWTTDQVLLGEEGVTTEEPRLGASQSLDGEKGDKLQSDVWRFGSNETGHYRILHTDVLSDSLLLGARNMMYNISLKNDRMLHLNKKIEWTSKEKDISSCRWRQKSPEECQNYIRVVVNKTSSELLVCGTNAYKPWCKTYRNDPGSYSYVYEESGIAKCPFSPEQNTTTVYADGRLYAGTVADQSGRDSLIYSHPLRTEAHDSQLLNEPDFVSSFEYQDNVYFFFREFAVEYINCGKAVFSRVGRVCKKDHGGPLILLNSWTSFFKSRLNCSIPGGFPFYFDEIQSTSPLGQGFFRPITDVSNRTDMVYAVFTTPVNSITGSAVCAFRVSDIIDTFEGAFKEQKTAHSNWLQVNERVTPNPHPTVCVNNSKELPDQALNFIKSHPLMDNSVPAFGGRPILLQTSFTSRMTQIAVDWQRKALDGRFYDVLFIGTDDGRVMKVINRGSGKKIDTVVIEELQVLSGAIINLQVYRARKDGQDEIEKLIVVSRDEVKAIPLHRCKLRTTCSACVALRDPYCSWDQNHCRANTGAGIQNIDEDMGRSCGSDRQSLSRNDNEIASSSSSSSVATHAPCVCPDHAPVKPTVDQQQRSTTTADQDHIEGDASNKHGDARNTLPAIVPGSLQDKEPEIGASRRVQTGSCSAATLAIATVLAIVFSLVVGFLAGYRLSLYRNKGHPDELFMGVKGDPQKNLNRFDNDPYRYNHTDHYVPQRAEKQLNVVLNPLKSNTKLPNGSAETNTKVQQKGNKVYL